jgi:two-component system, chemotaxis family, chemotaxis protein CheY
MNTEPKHEIDFSTIRLLLVDDEPFIRKLINRILFDIGIKDVTDVGDGEVALEQIRLRRAGFHVIICDLEMPKMGGLEFLRKLRKSDTPNIPTLILTGHSNEENIYDAIELGIHGFLSKPVSRKSLEAKLVVALTGDPINPSVIPGRAGEE